MTKFIEERTVYVTIGTHAYRTTMGILINSAKAPSMVGISESADIYQRMPDGTWHTLPIINDREFKVIYNELVAAYEDGNPDLVDQYQISIRHRLCI